MRTIVVVLALALCTTDAANHPQWVLEDRRLGWLTARRLALTVGTETNANALDETGCSATTADGGWGFCGPASCKDAYATCVTDEGGGPQTVDGTAGSWISYAGTDGASCSPFLDR